ncbi:MAG: MATE family efflux transporter [Clostridia bacterium]|nr:MATE family efflux transporter [Clostridia bacterium]
MIGIPVMLQSLIQSLVSLVDNFMVAGLGDVKMSGVSVAGQILFVFMVLSNAICAAGGIYITQFSGAKNSAGMRQALRFKFLLIGSFIALYLLVCFVFPRQILGMMVIGNAEAEAILDAGEEYMRLMGFMGIPFCVSVVLATSMREIGQVRAPLVISVIGTLVNCALNWVLIYGNLGAPRLEVRGAAYATIIARFVEMVLYILFVFRYPQPFMGKHGEKLCTDWKLFGEILRRGWLMLFSEVLWVISETVTTAVYNGRGGADVVSGMSAGWAIVNLLFVSFGGINTATAVIIGKTLGQGKLDEARKQKTWMLSAAVVFGLFMTLMGGLATLLAPLVFGHLSQVAQDICRDLVLLVSLYMPLWVYTNVQFSVARAGGDTVMGAVVDGCVTLIVVIPGILMLAQWTDWGPVLMYGVLKLTDIVKIITAHLWLKKEKWVRNLTVQPV